MLFSQIALPGDMVMLVTFEVELCGVTSMMSVCVPVIALEPDHVAPERRAVVLGRS